MTAENPEQAADPGREPDEAQEQSFTFSDKRRIDPETGQVRQPDGSAEAHATGEAAAGAADPAAAAGAGSAGAGAQAGSAGAGDAAEADTASASNDESEVPAAEAGEEVKGEGVADEAAKYLDDLQRLNAEYAAYRRRSERDQAKAKEAGMVSLVEALVPVLDEVKLAAENGDVTGPFETHVSKLVEALGKAGVEQYGAVGDEFDPELHEALMQQPSEEATEPTIFLVMQPGYKLGDRVIRAARVGVHLPQE